MCLGKQYKYLGPYHRAENLVFAWFDLGYSGLLRSEPVDRQSISLSLSHPASPHLSLFPPLFVTLPLKESQMVINGSGLIFFFL